MRATSQSFSALLSAFSIITITLGIVSSGEYAKADPPPPDACHACATTCDYAPQFDECTDDADQPNTGVDCICNETGCVCDKFAYKGITHCAYG